MRLRKIIVIIASVTIGLILILDAYRKGYLDMITIMFADPLWVSVFITGVLVVINIYYAWQTRQTLAEMEKARKSEFLPYVKTRLDFLGPKFLILRMTNVGKGPAMDIDATVSFSPSSEVRYWKQNMMAPDEFHRILLPDGNIDTVCEKAAKITIKGNYRDILGQTFSIDEEVDTKKFIVEMQQLPQLIEPNLGRLISDIKDELRGLKSEIRRIGQTIRSERSNRQSKE